MRALWVIVGTIFFFLIPSAGFSKDGDYPVVTLSEKFDCGEAEMEYPVFGRPALDKSVRNWAESYFKKVMGGYKKSCAEAKENAKEAAKEAKEAGEEEGGWLSAMSSSWTFYGGFNVTTTPGAVSIGFDFTGYTGGAHEAYWSEPLTLDKEGKELGLADLFAKPEGLWEFLSKYAHAALRPTLGESWDDGFSDGLAPKADSFKRFVVIPHGLTLIFPAYQVAPWAVRPAGQDCAVPLTALAKFVPKPDIWGQPQTVSPSFDCEKAGNPVEAAICAEPLLAQYDVDMAAEYKRALAVADDKEALIKEQGRWRQQMQSECVDATLQCIYEHYATRLSELSPPSDFVYVDGQKVPRSEFEREFTEAD